MLIAIVVYTLMFRFPLGHGFSRFLILGGVIFAIIYAVRRLTSYAVGTPVEPYSRPIDRRPRDYRPTRDELRQAAQLRRDQRMAAMEERREMVRQAREARREKKATRRYNRAYANVSPSAKRSVTLRQRMLELSSSASFAAVTTVLITGGVMLASTFLTGINLALFAMLTIVGSWALLSTGKFLEGGDHGWGHKRLVLLVGGVLVGLAAWFMTTNLFVTFETEANPQHHVGSVFLTDAARQPTLACFALFFGGLFALRRWTWHVDAFRDRRFRLRTVLLTTGIAWVWALVIGFPMMWGVTLAAALSSVVQLSAAWIPPQDRHRMMTEAQNNE
ncbi:MAG: hypothetical protein KDA84_12255 [Planctomycetaceae bacterium]|nr:hypothetical protein [Planctomycetaceae bacterium]